MSTSWWAKEGLRFECQGSGKCCTSDGEFGFVFLTLSDRKQMAQFLKLSLAKFTRQYCDKSGPIYHLKENIKNPDCLFLKDKKCSIYQARPTQCRTWPFWPEVMPAKAWKKDVVSFCPGVGKGKLWSPEEIKSILQQQIDSEQDLLTNE